jgi:hypothetical protein
LGYPRASSLVHLLAWSAVSITGASRPAFGGHADASNTLMVAKNLLAGNGFAVNYVWAFFHLPPIPHPEDGWPLFYPTLVAISIAILGTYLYRPVTSRSIRLPRRWDRQNSFLKPSKFIGAAKRSGKC